MLTEDDAPRAPTEKRRADERDDRRGGDADKRRREEEPRRDDRDRRTDDRRYAHGACCPSGVPLWCLYVLCVCLSVYVF